MIEYLLLNAQFALKALEKFHQENPRKAMFTQEEKEIVEYMVQMIEQKREAMIGPFGEVHI